MHTTAIQESPRQGSTATLFEARLLKLSHVLEELRAVDRQREIELKALREQMFLMREQHRREVMVAVSLIVQELDSVIGQGQRLMHPDEPQPQTPFERMCAQMATRNDQRQLEDMYTLLESLHHVRQRLEALAKQPAERH